jgi:hypothetical protein
MPERMDDNDLRPELRSDEALQVAITYLDLMANILHIIDTFRKNGAPSMTFTDYVIAVHVFGFRETGTRAQTLIDYMLVPRRTIRDSLARMERDGIVLRRDGRFYPTAIVPVVFNQVADLNMEKLNRLCDAIGEYRKILGVIRPE